MKIYTFRCARKADLFGVTEHENGDNLPLGICNEWVKTAEQTVQPGDSVAGFVSQDLFRDIIRQGFHIAVADRSNSGSSGNVEIGKAIAAASCASGFFRSNSGA